ncbi:MAG: hypothetical protein EOP49_20225, partial [Sphingobacteriales bacterium]
MNKKILLLTICLLACCACFAQSSMPAFRNVVQKFLGQYAPVRTDALSFARKRDGWYVCITDATMPGKEPAEYQYWKTGKGYLPLGQRFARQTMSGDEAAGAYLLQHSTDVYAFDRCPYFGYTHWDRDIIKDFSAQPNKSDKTLEALARACSNHASKYLWNQYSHVNVLDDSLMAPLTPLAAPGAMRIARAEEYYRRAVGYYRELCIQNPHYQTLIGDARLRLFNEGMSAWLHMVLAHDQESAAAFLKDVVLDEEQVNIARNTLSACAPNSILFTYGDNNTFQLWYVQQKLHEFTGIKVINMDLLALPVYPLYVSGQLGVKIRTSPECYSDMTMDYALYRPDGSGRSTLSDWLDDIRNQWRNRDLSDGKTVFHYKSLAPVLKLQNESEEVYPGVNAGNTIRISLSSYVTRDALLQLDIIEGNINDMPIYYTDEKSMLKKSFMDLGQVLQVVPADDSEAAGIADDADEIVVRYMESVYRPVHFPAHCDNGYRMAADREFNSRMRMVKYYARMHKDPEQARAMDELYLYAKKDAQKLYSNQVKVGELLLAQGRTEQGQEVIELAAGVCFEELKNPANPAYPISNAYALEFIQYSR